MSRALRFLVLDGYPPEGRKELTAAGASEAGRLYRDMLLRLSPGAAVEVAYPADADFALPSGARLTDYAGIAWTGSSLTIHRSEDPRVRAQVELARAAFEARVPSFGSCWAAQLAATAAGGSCAANPRGREFGLARKIAATDAGRGHPLFAGRAPVFDAFTSHADEVAELPRSAVLLASNAFTRVQALAVEHRGGVFWALQYHPEYDLHELARLCAVRTPWLVEQGNFRDAADAAAFVDQLEALHADPSRADLAWQLGIDADVLDEGERCREVASWIRHQVAPRAAG